MGVNSGGVFAGLTNRPRPGTERDARSRGLLVLEALSRPSAREAREEARAGARAHRYNPFHLLCADGRETHLLSLRDERPVVRELGAGVHVLSNRDPEERDDPKVMRLREQLGELDLGGRLERVLESLRAVLATHADAEDPRAGACTHAPGYGTRSSSLIALGPARSLFWHAEGPPCDTKYQDLTPLLEELRQAS
jgi:uncharacterized protein with NRDE domain